MSEDFFQELDARMANYDLLCHPFYKAWAAGELSRDDLREYATDYYHHVAAFPAYLCKFAERLPMGELRSAVLANMADENGEPAGLDEARKPHSELWLDFAEGMGAQRDVQRDPIPEIRSLIEHFTKVAAEGSPEAALAAFYAYESQVPRVAEQKARGLRHLYGADEKTCAYFTLHITADRFHSHVWRQQLEKQLKRDGANADIALQAGEAAALSLWRALDGIEARRQSRVAA
ncbi:MAG TPA: iron-containing redox enzyme family protein [Terriglobales bacterium]|nr:iron-containing redox enzyme family protein [Terriglobales bacterium]